MVSTKCFGIVYMMSMVVICLILMGYLIQLSVVVVVYMGHIYIWNRFTCNT